jgi:hypothetical protein
MVPTNSENPVFLRVEQLNHQGLWNVQEKEDHNTKIVDYKFLKLLSEYWGLVQCFDAFIPKLLEQFEQ